MADEDVPEGGPEHAIAARATKWAAQIQATTSRADRRQRRADGVATVLTLAGGRVAHLEAAEAWLRIELDVAPGPVREEAVRLVAAALAAARALPDG